MPDAGNPAAGRTLPKYRKPLERPAVAAKVRALMIEGLSDREIAERIKVSRQAITAFRARHPQEIERAAAEVVRQVEEAAIAHKVNRVLDADADYQRLGQVIAARAADERYDEPGYATGMMVHRIKAIGTGKHQTIVDEFEVDTAVIAERRALRKAVAEELDQLPRGSNAQIGVGVEVVVRTLIGMRDEDIR